MHDDTPNKPPPDRSATSWRAALRATRPHADPGVWRTRLAARLFDATHQAGASHLTVVTCERNRPDACDYGYFPRREVGLGDLVFSRIMPRLLAQCRPKWDEGLARYGPVVPVFDVFGGGPVGGPFRTRCAAAGIDGALLGGFWVDSALVGYLMVAGAGDEGTLWRRLAPDLERVVADAEKTLAFAVRMHTEGTSRRAATAPIHAPLSARERDVAALARDGYSDANIAARLGIKEATVGTHLHRIYRKLGVHNRVGLVQRLGHSPHGDAPTAIDDLSLHERAARAYNAVASASTDEAEDPPAPSLALAASED